jgi:nitrite reductase (cytochrome c-552)
MQVKGHRFKDWVHAETGVEVLKAQHPEFELWSQGVHARSGVACADCHMPYKREGAMKVSEHWVRSPLLGINRACEPLKAIGELQRAAQWRLDFVAAENSMGFHAPQEMARILGESIDLSRQAQVKAVELLHVP